MVDFNKSDNRKVDKSSTYNVFTDDISFFIHKTFSDETLFVSFNILAI